MRLFRVLLFTILSSVTLHTPAIASTYSAAPPPPGLSLSAAPPIVDVGGQVNITVSALQWPASAAVSASFVSPHHGFSGNIPWNASCNCFQVAVALARRVHGLEQAHVLAKVTVRKTVFTLKATFQIRGLAPNGRDFAPGGSVHLIGWVSDPQPVRKEKVHFCAWTRTLDGFGVAGYNVKIAVHFHQHSSVFYAKPTNVAGITCAQRSIGNAQLGFRVVVDMYSAGQHITASFVPRA